MGQKGQKIKRRYETIEVHRDRAGRFSKRGPIEEIKRIIFRDARGVFRSRSDWNVSRKAHELARIKRRGKKVLIKAIAERKGYREISVPEILWEGEEEEGEEEDWGYGEGDADLYED